jgi:hypothetical protein
VDNSFSLDIKEVTVNNWVLFLAKDESKTAVFGVVLPQVGLGQVGLGSIRFAAFRVGSIDPTQSKWVEPRPNLLGRVNPIEPDE